MDNLLLGIASPQNRAGCHGLCISYPAYRLARVNLLSIDPEQPTKTDRFGPEYALAVLKAVTRNKLKM